MATELELAQQRITELEAEVAALRSALEFASNCGVHATIPYTDPPTCFNRCVVCKVNRALASAPAPEPDRADADALTGCSDDQRFSDAEVNVIKRYLAQKSEPLAEPERAEDTDRPRNPEWHEETLVIPPHQRIGQAIVNAIGCDDSFEQRLFNIEDKALRAALGAKP
jgi:hypothetical protein